MKTPKNLRLTLSMMKHNRDVSTTPSWVGMLDDDEDPEFYRAPGYIFYTLTLCNTFIPMFFLSLLFYCFCELKWKHSDMVPKSFFNKHMVPNS